MEDSGYETFRGLLFVFGVLSLIVAAIYWLTRSAIREGVQAANPDRPPVASATPVVEGPGTFKISGVDRATKMDTTWHVAAASAENAKVKAELEGIVITAIERVAPEPSAAPQQTREMQQAREMQLEADSYNRTLTREEVQEWGRLRREREAREGKD